VADDRMLARRRLGRRLWRRLGGRLELDGLERRRALRARLLGGRGLFGGLLLPRRLLLRRLGRPEELRERAFTHARALSRHRAPPSRVIGTPPRPGRWGRT